MQHHKLPRDPLASVKKPNPEKDRRLERRMLLPDEWSWLEATTLNSPKRFGMSGGQRVVLYRAAIETGLRSGELRSLTRGRLFLDDDRSFITCKSGSTKNAKDARQFIQTELAEQLREHVRTKAPGATVFSLPEDYDMADMLRADLADARGAWLEASKHDAKERLRRDQSDFLKVTNHEGESLDFHALRHTCGAWLAMTGAHPKVVQAVMRHSTITLTMDTYGHLFPGQEADAVDGLRSMFNPMPEAMQATGTDERSARRSSQDAKRCVSNATTCEDDSPYRADEADNEPEPNTIPITDLGDRGRLDADQCDATITPLAPLAQLAEQLTLNQ